MKYAIQPRVQAAAGARPWAPVHPWEPSPSRVLTAADHPADLDAYQLALRTLVDAVDRHARDPLRSELADALGQARELLDQDREAP